MSNNTKTVPMSPQIGVKDRIKRDAMSIYVFAKVLAITMVLGFIALLAVGFTTQYADGWTGAVAAVAIVGWFYSIRLLKAHYFAPRY